MSRAYPLVPGVPAAGHVTGGGHWHPGKAGDGCVKCPTPDRFGVLFSHASEATVPGLVLPDAGGGVPRGTPDDRPDRDAVRRRAVAERPVADQQRRAHACRGAAPRHRQRIQGVVAMSELDTESSASRQHYIDTGDYLPSWRRWRFVIDAEFPPEVTRAQLENVLGDAEVQVAEPVLERHDGGGETLGESRLLSTEVRELPPGPGRLLEDLRASLPVGHPELPGVIRSIELLRAGT